jgi:hypothetical protein
MPSLHEMRKLPVHVPVVLAVADIDNSRYSRYALPVRFPPVVTGAAGIAKRRRRVSRMRAAARGCC